jgi:inosine-uridine nucleoside N-ribohydrolase
MGKPAPGVIFDTDMGTRIDDALAFALLYGLDGKNEVRVVCVSTSRFNLKSAAFCETVGRFYAGAVSGAFMAAGRTLPVGMAVEGSLRDETPMISAPLERKTEDGKPVYNHGIQQLIDTAETPAVIRNALTGQHDQNAIVVCTGPATNLARVLGLPGVKDLVAAKARYLVWSAGDFSGGAAEFNVKSDLEAAKKVLADWPTPVLFAGAELTNVIPFPAASIEKDFAWSQAHPVADAYRAFAPMPYDAPTQDMIAVLQAVRPKENYFKLSEPGTVSVSGDGRTTFAPAANGKHQFLSVDPSQKDRVLAVFTELASAKPVPRAPRFPRQQQQQQQKKDAVPPSKPEVKQP